MSSRLHGHSFSAISKAVTGRPDTSALSTEESPALDVVIDTDIGTDVDDAYAVLLAFSSPELNVRGLTIVHGDVGLRAKIAAKLLKLAGRADITLALGERSPMRPDRPITWLGHEGRGLDFSDVEDLTPAKEHGAGFIARTADEHAGGVTLITIGPLTNAGVLVRDFPREASKLRGIVAMASTFNGFGSESAGREHNASVDPEAMELVFQSGVPTLIVGLNVTLQTALNRSHLAQIGASGTSLSRLMVYMTEEWLRVIDRDVAYMHDPLAVAASFDAAVVTTIPVTPEVSKERAGFVAYHEAGTESPVRICTAVDTARFDQLFYSRILRAVANERGCQ